MKSGIHPENYREVCFRDVSADVTFVTTSTVETEKTITLEGKEYPLVDLDVSQYSHPFYTGQQRLFDREGRVDKFKKKYNRK